MNIGARIKEVRKLKGKKLKEAAAGAGVDLKMYQHYEAGRTRTPVEVLISLSEFYGYYSIDALLGNIEEKEHFSKVLTAYGKSTPEKRKIVDFILSLNN